jgi:hypothetical protein
MFHDLSIKVMHKAKLYIPSTIKTQMSLVLLLLLGTMAIPVVEFSREGYKIRNIFG